MRFNYYYKNNIKTLKNLMTAGGRTLSDFVFRGFINIKIEQNNKNLAYFYRQDFFVFLSWTTMFKN